MERSAYVVKEYRERCGTALLDATLIGRKLSITLFAKNREACFTGMDRAEAEALFHVLQAALLDWPEETPAASPEVTQ